MARVLVIPDHDNDSVLMCGSLSLADLDGAPARTEAFMARLASALTLAEGKELDDDDQLMLERAVRARLAGSVSA